jgi:hypothetical protein
MAVHGTVARRHRRRRNLTKPDASAPPLPDLVGRLFDPDHPDHTWVGDVTCVPNLQQPPSGQNCTRPRADVHDGEGETQMCWNSAEQACPTAGELLEICWWTYGYGIQT